VGGGVGQLLAGVAAAADDAPLVDDDGADRHILGVEGGHRLADRLLHELLVLAMLLAGQVLHRTPR